VYYNSHIKKIASKTAAQAPVGELHAGREFHIRIGMKKNRAVFSAHPADSYGSLSECKFYALTCDAKTLYVQRMAQFFVGGAKNVGGKQFWRRQMLIRYMHVVK